MALGAASSTGHGSGNRRAATGLGTERRRRAEWVHGDATRHGLSRLAEDRRRQLEFDMGSLNREGQRV
ncbi:hypothetical protein M0R45_006037 [Rubus argutus]|uniref:Uncharacterized protein n=1 Tax=Rubus argutus TaxID=59490 RepID=A0AAW1YP91_RUBAR